MKKNLRFANRFLLLLTPMLVGSVLTNVALVEVTTNEAKVVAPEPSNSLALLLCSGVIGIALKGRHEENTPACSLEAKVAKVWVGTARSFNANIDSLAQQLTTVETSY